MQTQETYTKDNFPTGTVRTSDKLRVIDILTCALEIMATTYPDKLGKTHTTNRAGLYSVLMDSSLEFYKFQQEDGNALVDVEMYNTLLNQAIVQATNFSYRDEKFIAHRPIADELQYTLSLYLAELDLLTKVLDDYRVANHDFDPFAAGRDVVDPFQILDKIVEENTGVTTVRFGDITDTHDFLKKDKPQRMNVIFDLKAVTETIRDVISGPTFEPIGEKIKRRVSLDDLTDMSQAREEMDAERRGYGPSASRRPDGNRAAVRHQDADLNDVFQLLEHIERQQNFAADILVSLARPPRPIPRQKY